MLGRCGLGIIVVGLLAGLACGATEPNAPAGSQRSGWEGLKLVKTTVAGMTVYYEKALEPNLPIFERELKSVLAARDNPSALWSRRSEVIADINRILGVTDPNLAERERDFVQMTGVFSQTKLTLYLVRTTTIKDRLRAGAQLPSFRYDRQTDSVTYQPQISVERGQKPPETYDLCLPIQPDARFVPGTLDMVRMMQGSGLGDVAIHELTEMALLQRARPSDPYWRWFSDGVANAVTERLVERYLGKEAAAEFGKSYDLDPYRDQEREINLRYWMLGNYFPYVSTIPVESESKLLHARYACATFEAKRLIDANGLDGIRRILDKVVARESRTGVDLLEVIKEVTGQDMTARLGRYQTFGTKEEGIPEYAATYQSALQAKDWEKMFFNVLRIMELRGDVYSANYLQNFANAALFLFQMGHEDAGDAAMRQAIDLYSKGPLEHGREVALDAFILYALQCSHPAKAEQEADELLRTRPTAPLPLAVRMLLAAQRGNVSEAKVLALQIQGQGGEQSIPYKLAAQVLAIDPNQAKTYN